MKYNILDFLSASTSNFPEKIAVTDGTNSYTYKELTNRSKAIGSGLLKHINAGEPVGIFMEKDANAVASFYGVCAAGGFYCVLNNELPASRLTQIYCVLQPKVIITTKELAKAAKESFEGAKLLIYEELIASDTDEVNLAARKSSHIDTNPLYINFTSGSTGTPKGIVVCHRSVIDFINCFTETFNFNSDDVIANQAPFDFDVSVKDIYSSVKTGATLLVIPRRLFSAPVELIDFICEHKATTMTWAVSALCLLSTFHALEYRTPTTINKILFSGEVMPLKALKNFKKFLPDVMYVNLYGPTEITCNCTYHILDNEADYSGGIPIGKAFPNEDVFLLDEDNNKITEVEVVGEICVRGTALAHGYYNQPEQTSKSFVQNPLNPYYPEIIYRTGDLGRLNENGDIVFSGRKDFQIKYMGHRIELEEIEREMSSIDGVVRCCCLFDEKKSRLKGFYVGTIDKDELHRTMKASLPAFMVPGMLRRLDDMPLTKNGKIDRKLLAESVG